MSMTAELVSREAVPVEIGDITLYCEGFKSGGVRSFSEEVSVSGECVITNSAVRSARLTLSGRVYFEDSPMKLVAAADRLIRKNTYFDISLYGALYSNCLLQSYSLEDSGDSFLKATVTVITSDPVTEADNNDS